MEISKMSLPSTGYLLVKLDKEVLDKLWQIIEVGKRMQNLYKYKLAGNITQSYQLNDDNDFFYKDVCIPTVKEFRNMNGGSDPGRLTTVQTSNTNLLLKDFWVNYQYQNEFNPLHFHNGVYSFTIWMKIPYDWKEQTDMPQFQGTETNKIKAGCFEFGYSDSIGMGRNMTYQLSPDLEGYMVFFPAGLMHQVFPFYGSNEPRVSIAGNLWYVTSAEHTNENVVKFNA